MERSFFRREKNVTYQTEKNGVPNPAKTVITTDDRMENSVRKMNTVQSLLAQRMRKNFLADGRLTRSASLQPPPPTPSGTPQTAPISIGIVYMYSIGVVGGCARG